MFFIHISSRAGKEAVKVPLISDLTRTTLGLQDEDDFLPEDEDMEVSLGSSIPISGVSKMDFLKYSISPGFKQ